MVLLSPDFFGMVKVLYREAVLLGLMKKLSCGIVNGCPFFHSSSILILFKRSSRSWAASIFDAAFIIASLFILGYSKRSETYRSAFSLYTDSKSSEYRILILYSYHFTSTVKRQLNILVHSCCNEVETAMNG